jgi:AraC-like DNA-binding protein
MIEKIVWSAPQDLPGIVTLSAENSQRPWCQYHETYTICNINDSGAGQEGALSPPAAWVYRGKTHSSAPRSVMLIEPGELHRNIRTPPPNPFSVVLIHPKLVNDIASEAGMRLNPHFKKAVSSDSPLYRTLVQFHGALAAQTTLLHRQSLLIECILALLGGYCEQTPRLGPDPKQRCLERARDFIREHFSEKITLDQLAEISALSRYHFQRSFAREFGLPPHRYQISLRIEKVCQALRSGQTANSIDSGFSDQSHLIRHFKRLVGVTPARYAAMVRSKSELPVALLRFKEQERSIQVRRHSSQFARAAEVASVNSA